MNPDSSEAHRGQHWVLISASVLCVASLIALALVHAWRVPFFAGDDQAWLLHASRGLPAIWSEPSPFSHFRPTFGSWLFLAQQIGADSPAGLALGALALHIATALLTYWAFRPLIPASACLVAAAIVCLHPARQQHLFWTSAGIDAICLLLSLACIGAAIRDHRRRSVRSVHLTAVCLATFLAVLSKETALALPLVVLALPGWKSWRRKLVTVAASATGAIIAAGAVLLVVPGGGRSAALLAPRVSAAALVYPIRLVWPGDHESWHYLAAVRNEPGHLLWPAALTVAALALLAWAWRGRWRSAWAGTGLLLVAAGFLPWIVRQEDRGIGLGVVGLGLLVSGAVTSRGAIRPLFATALILTLVLAWSPIWMHRQRSWIEASLVSQRIAAAHRSWRIEAGPEPLLVAVGTMSRVAWSCEVLGLDEIDRCATHLLGVVGPSPATEVEVVAAASGSRLFVSATGDSVLRWGGQPVPGLGVVELSVDDANHVRAAVIEPARLEPLAAKRGCKGVNLRVWDGTTFATVAH
jgi:hypothetical protein